MYEALTAISHGIQREFSLPMIPAGEVIQTLRKLPSFDYANGGRSLCKDGYHMELIYGRYAVAAVWYRTLLKADLFQNSFVPSETAEKSILDSIRELVMKTVCLEIL